MRVRVRGGGGGRGGTLLSRSSCWRRAFVNSVSLCERVRPGGALAWRRARGLDGGNDVRDEEFHARAKLRHARGEVLQVQQEGGVRFVAAQDGALHVLRTEHDPRRIFRPPRAR